MDWNKGRDIRQNTSYDAWAPKTIGSHVKPFYQVLFCLAWVFAVFYMISRPPVLPPFFPEQEGVTAPSRASYNPALAAALDQGLRDFWQKPEQVLDALGDLNGLKVADIGCGEGYFTLKLLERVGPEGKVFANDIQQEMLYTLDSRIPDHLRERVVLVLGGQDTGITEKVDVIMLIQVFGEISDRPGFLAQLKKIMHEKSRLVIIDSKHLTDPVNGFTRPLNLNKLIDEFRENGLVFPPEFQLENFRFLPKQFFFVLELEK